MNYFTTYRIGAYPKDEELSIPVSPLTTKNVQVGFIFRLPFRLPLGKQSLLEDQELGIEVCCLNSVEIPHMTPIQQAELTFKIDGPDGQELTSSEVMVILKNPAMGSEDLQAFKSDLTSGANPTGRFMRLYPLAVKELNQLIIACGADTATFSNNNRPRVFPDGVNQDILKGVITFICPVDYKLSGEEIIEAFSIKSSWSGFTAVVTPDLTKEEKQDIPNRIEKQKKFPFYEFIFTARSLSAMGDNVSGLLMAVVALEGVHAAFVRVALANKIATIGEKPGVVINNLLRDQGFHTLSQITPFLLMEPGERPDIESCRGCLRAIEIRNAFMHLLTDSQGKYKFKKFSDSDLYISFSSVNKVFQAYESALSDRLKISAITEEGINNENDDNSISSTLK